MGKTIISCKGVKKTYGDQENKIEALRGIDLEINEGELTLLVGPSGSGKTTLLSIIATLLTPDQGEVWLLDQKVENFSDHEKVIFRRNHLGIIFQSLFLIPTLSVLENVTLPLLIAGKNERQSRKKALHLLKLMDIDHRADDSPGHLSKGQQQRVAIARAVINDSKIIVCDEPTSALDHAHGMEVMKLLQELAISRAVIVVTHDHRIFSFANRIVYMDDGKISTSDEYELFMHNHGKL